MRKQSLKERIDREYDNLRQRKFTWDSSRGKKLARDLVRYKLCKHFGWKDEQTYKMRDLVSVDIKLLRNLGLGSILNKFQGILDVIYHAYPKMEKEFSKIVIASIEYFLEHSEGEMPRKFYPKPHSDFEKRHGISTKEVYNAMRRYGQLNTLEKIKR